LADWKAIHRATLLRSSSCARANKIYKSHGAFGGELAADFLLRHRALII
jgi:hypothetical protein